MSIYLGGLVAVTFVNVGLDMLAYDYIKGSTFPITFMVYTTAYLLTKSLIERRR